MANFHREINRMIEKLIYKLSILDKEGIRPGIKGEKLSLLDIYLIKMVGNSKTKSIYSLVNETEIDRKIIASIINKLVKFGYLYKRKSEEDKRVYNVTLTEEGLDIYNRILNEQKRSLDFILNDVSLNEEKAILKFLSKVNQRILNLSSKERKKD